MARRSWRDRIRRAASPAPEQHGHPHLRRRIEALEQTNQQLARRLDEAEAGLQEQRHLNLRIAELTDLVTTVIAAAAQGDEELRRALDAAVPSPTEPPG